MVIMGFTLVFLGGSRKKHTKAYVGIQMSGVNANRTPTKKWGIVVGGVFCPIPSKTPLGVNQQYPNGPYCTWTCVRNPIFDEMGALCPNLWLSLVGQVKKMEVPKLGQFDDVNGSRYDW